MSMPALMTRQRLPVICGLAALAVAQAVAAAVIAFATRDLFMLLSSNSLMPGDASGVPATTAVDSVPQSSHPAIAALLLIISMTLLIAALRIAERSVSEFFGQSYASLVRHALFGHFMKMSSRDLAERRTGTLAIRFVGDLSAVKSWVSMGITRMISVCIVLPGAVLALFWLNPQFALVASVPLALAILLMAILAPRLKTFYQSVRHRRVRLAADMSERVPVAPELNLLGRQRKELDKLKRSATRLRTAAVQKMAASATLRAVPEVGCGMAAAGVLWTAFANALSAAETAGALAILGIVALPLRDLAGVWDRYRAWQLASQKCQDVFNRPVLTSIHCNKVKPGDGEFQTPCDLTLSKINYGNLRKLSAHAKAGETVAIVGPNGVGKSSLLQLIAGLVEPESGTIFLANSNLRSIMPGQRNRLIALAGPRSPILKGSLRRALTLGITPRPEDQKILLAIEQFGLNAVVQRMGGLDGKVSEQGRNLSAGEIRRLQLARVWLAKPLILLLDEPDDALDYNSIKLVEKLLRDSDATTFLVTHNPLLLHSADTIWYLAAGKIAEQGQPAELLSRQCLTADLFHLNRAQLG